MESVEAYWEREGAKVEKAVALAKLMAFVGISDDDTRQLVDGLLAADELLANSVPIEMA